MPSNTAGAVALELQKQDKHVKHMPVWSKVDMVAEKHWYCLTIPLAGLFGKTTKP